MTNLETFNKEYQTFFECIIPFKDFVKGQRYWFERYENGEYGVLSDNTPQIKWKRYTITDGEFNNNFIISW